jgi:uncharacterized protein YndB with AHSA1/START domain
MNTKINQEHGKYISAAEVRFVRLLPGPIERAWEYLTDPEKRRLWFCGGTTAKNVGGKMTLEFRNQELAPGEAVPEEYKEHAKEGILSEAVITRCERPRVYAFMWGEGEVVFELAPQGDKVQLTLTHRKLPDRKELLGVSGGWHVHLNVLVAKLEGGKAPPFWSTLGKVEREYEKLAPQTA